MNKIEELQLQIKQLEKQVKKLEMEQVPVPLENPDWSDVIDCATNYVKQLTGDEYDDDDDHWFFEAVMFAVYGKDIFKWIDSKT